METRPDNEAQEGLVVNAVRRHIGLILAVAVLLTLPAAWLAIHRQHTYVGEAKVLIRPITGNALSADSATSGQRVTVAMVTEAALVDSRAVAESAAAALKVPVETAMPSVVASVPPNTQLIDIKYTASDAERARAGTQSFADAYLAYRKRLAQAVVKAQLAGLEAQQKDVQAKLKAAGAAASLVDAKPDTNAQVQLYAGRLATIQNNIAAASATDTNPGSVVTPAALPGPASNIVDQLLIPVAALLGLLLGFVLALWRERRDDQLRGGSEHSFYGAPLLAAIPAGSGARKVASLGTDPVSEHYRQARAGILAARGAKGNAFAVAGTSAGIVVADVAVNVGLALSRSGYRTAIVDASAGHENIAALLGVTPAAGLSEVLRGTMAPAQLPSSAVEINGVYVIGGGAEAGASRDLFHSEEMATAVAALRDAFDYVLLVAPGLPTAEGSGVALAATSVIFVAEDRRTTHADVANAVERCQELGSTILGVIVVPAAASRWQNRRRGSRPETESSGVAALTASLTATPSG